MRQYSFFLSESVKSNIEYHIRKPDELDKNQIIDVCKLLDLIGKEHVSFGSKLGLVAKNDQLSFSPSDYEKRILNKKNTSFQLFFTAEYEGKIVGLYHYREYLENEYKGNSGEIVSVIVDPNFRKMGIGSKLMNLCKSYVKKNRPAVRIFIGVHSQNSAAIALYNKSGFVPVHQMMVCKL